MATIVTRAGKGSALTHTEMDANFTNINVEVGTKISDVEGTAVLSTGETGGVKYLREDGDGTSSWQTVTNTTYSAGTGLDLSGTTFSIEPDLRDGITHVGRDTNDYIQIDTSMIRFYINGVNVMSCDSSGNIIAKGNVTAYGTPA